MGIITALISAIFIVSPPSIHPSQAAPGKVAHFNLENIAGGRMSSDDLKGKVAVVDVWATWCGPCIAEIPMYKRLYDAFEGQDDVAIVGIVIESPRRDIPAKVRQLGIQYPILIGDAEAVDTFGVHGTPTTVVLDKDGTIYKRYVGNVRNKEQKIKQDIQDLLGQNSPGQ
jgi:thiol-disulfide isomerase/thioredoxin